MVQETIENGISVLRPAHGSINYVPPITPIGPIIINTLFYMSSILLIAILIYLLVNIIKKEKKISDKMIFICVILFVIFVVAAYSKYGFIL